MRPTSLRQLVPGLFLLEAEKDGRFPYSHSFVVRGEVELLIDAGCGLERLRELRRVWRPDRLLISHSHPDHCAGAWLFPDAEIISPRERSDSFWRFGPQGIRFAGPDHAALWRAFVSDAMGIREFVATRHFGHGDLIDAGGITLECHHAPGHTDDHYVLFEPHRGIAFTFDIDLSSFGPWYGHVESDIDRFLSSIALVAALEPRMLLSSHKGVITEDIEGRLRAFAAVVESRDRCILELLGRPRRIVELIEASPIYGGRAYAPGVLDYWEGQMIAKHLERLERQGRAHRTGPGDADLGDLELDGNHAEGPQGAAAKPDRFHDRTRWLRR
jgi:glyoxylase-like metal-dependent hydrolase (beta-lactamase superfamily II)